MPSVEDLLTSILGALGAIRKPAKIIRGYKDDIDTGVQRITDRPTPVRKVVVVKVRSLGTGTYIALGDDEEQPFRLTAVGQSLDVDWIDDLSKVHAATDAGSTGALEWIGG